MKIVLTGGGSAGHVTPHIAIIPDLLEKGFDISYIGTANGIEHQLMQKENIRFYSISAGKLRRYSSFKNVTDLFRINQGFWQALLLLQKIKPNVVFSKGGFVSCPVVWAAWTSGIPVIIHESDITPGLANRLCLPFAKVICYSFPETNRYIQSEKGILTGIPVRDEIHTGKAEIGRQICNFNGGKPIMLIMGGSLGSASLNEIIRDTLKNLLHDFQVAHICGKGNADPTHNDIDGYRQFEYVNEELPHLFAASDLIISRAGATTLFEILALKKPNLLIPLPVKASRGDQIINACFFEAQGFSRVLEEENLNKETFIRALTELYNNTDKYILAMSKDKMRNSTQQIVEIICKLAK